MSRTEGAERLAVIRERAVKAADEGGSASLAYAGDCTFLLSLIDEPLWHITDSRDGEDAGVYRGATAADAIRAAHAEGWPVDCTAEPVEPDPVLTRLREALTAIAEESPDGGAVACAREALGLEALDDAEMAALVKARGGRDDLDALRTRAEAAEQGFADLEEEARAWETDIRAALGVPTMPREEVAAHIGDIRKSLVHPDGDQNIDLAYAAEQTARQFADEIQRLEAAHTTIDARDAHIAQLEAAQAEATRLLRSAVDAHIGGDATSTGRLAHAALLALTGANK